MKTVNSSRRDFIKTTAFAAGSLFAAPSIIPASALGKGGSVTPSDRIVMGFIGVGEMGSGHVRSFIGHKDVQAVAVCDVRQSHAERAKVRIDQKNGNSDCAVYHDFRDLLARKDIDAVLIAVPDHWHALIGIEAARQGKHMYYEKPLSLSIAESKAVRQAVKRYGVVFQFGTQQRSDERFRFACELVRNGKIGELETIMIGSATYEPIPTPPEQPIPDGFDYNSWLGPAPVSPYSFERCTRQWTLISDYSLGCVGGAWGIHPVDIAQMANKADQTVPISVEGSGVFPENGLYDTAVAWEAEHVYENGVRLVHMDRPTALKKAAQFNIHWEGILFLGSEGWFFVSREKMDAHPKSLLYLKIKSNEERLPKSQDHRRNFLDAVKTKQIPMSPVETAASSDFVCHQANIAMRLGRKLYWDPEKEEFKNDPEANRLLSRPMRSPWHL